MSSIFDRLRSGAGKAAFEADKLRRIASIQSNIRSLKEEINQAFYRAGYVAFEAYRDRAITQPDLLAVCERIAAFQEQLAAREREIETIRNEAYIEPTSDSGADRICPNGHGELPPGAQYCPVCGAQAIAASASAGGAACPACGAEVAPGTHFCPKCGTPVIRAAEQAPTEPSSTAFEETTPAPPLRTSVVCAACGTVLAPNAPFCPNCDAPAPTSEPRSVKLGDAEPVCPEEFSSPPSEFPEPAQTSSTKVPKRCPECGFDLVSEGSFCPDCGHRLIRDSDSASRQSESEAAVSLTPETSEVEIDDSTEWTS